MSNTEDFKRALGSWASGVSVVTACVDGLHYGLTVSSFSSVSLDPPLVMVCLSNHNRAVEMIRTSGRLAVSILARDQEAASNYFAASGREPAATFGDIAHEETGHGVLAVAGAMAWLACDLHEAVEMGDHTIVVGEVREARIADEGMPLMYWRRAYRGVTD